MGGQSRVVVMVVGSEQRFSSPVAEGVGGHGAVQRGVLSGHGQAYGGAACPLSSSLSFCRVLTAARCGQFGREFV
jgi:hypothetical protein